MDDFISNDKGEKYEIEPFNNPLVQDENIKIAILIPNEDNTDFIYQYINPKLAEYFNLSAEDFFGRSTNILFGKLRNKIYRIFKEVYETHQKDIMHINYYQENELKFRLKLNITFIEEGYLLVTAEDTSAEIHIKELHSFSKSSTYIQKSKKYGIGTKFENGFYIWSDGLYKIIDRKPLSYDKMHNIIYELIIPEERAKLEKFKQNLIDHPEKSCKDYFKILTNSNKTKTILLDIKKIFENNHLKKTAIIVHDVTEELETEKRYNILNDLNSFIYNNLNIASFIISYETNYYYASKNISEMFHLSKKHPKLMLYDLLNNIIDTEFKSMREQIHNNEISLIDGIYDYKSPIYDKVQKIQITYFKREYNGETYYVGGMRDITQEIEKENKILAANKNMELLINESNHRIKNNLNLLLRFISLEEKFHKQPAKIIDNLIGRINSLVLLHEKLSYTENNYDVNAVESFKKMTEDLYYTFNEQSSEITFKFDEYEEFKLPNDKMTPVLLILNEIVTNTFKYAYTSENNENEIYSYIKKEDNICECFIKDNGKGYPEGFDPKKSTGLGWLVITSLITQLNGEFEIYNDNGACFILRFPINE